MTNSTNWWPVADLAVIRHAVCHRTNDPMDHFRRCGQLVELAVTGRNMGKNWLNWIDNAYGVHHRTNGPMVQFHHWQPIGVVGFHAKSDDTAGRRLADAAAESFRKFCRWRRRGPWRFRWLAGFIIGPGFCVLAEQKNTTLQQQQRLTHDHL